MWRKGLDISNEVGAVVFSESGLWLTSKLTTAHFRGSAKKLLKWAFVCGPRNDEHDSPRAMSLISMQFQVTFRKSPVDHPRLREIRYWTGCHSCPPIQMCLVQDV